MVGLILEKTGESGVAARRFQRAYAGVTVATVRSTSQVAFQRVRQDQAAGPPNRGVYSSGDVSHFDDLQREMRLLACTPADAARCGVAGRGVAGRGVAGQGPLSGYAVLPGTDLLMALGCNSRRVTAAEAPRDWPGLVDPTWRGKVAVGRPGLSGYAGTWAPPMRRLRGDGFFERFAANQPPVGRSSNGSVTRLNGGERAVAASPTHAAVEGGRRGNPVAAGYQMDEAPPMVSPAATLAGAPRPAAVKLFMAWLPGAENRSHLVAQGGVRLNTEAANATDRPALSEIKTRWRPVRGIVEGFTDRAAKWRDVLGG